MVRTPRDGAHVYFQQCRPALTNSRGSLPAGIDMRGAGGYVIAPGAMLGNRRSYAPIEGQPELAAAFAAKTIPEVPAGIVELIRPAPAPRQLSATAAAARPARASAPTPRARCAGSPPSSPARRRGTRNDALNKAAFVLGTMVARDWISAQEVEDALTARWSATATSPTRAARRSPPRWRPGSRPAWHNPHDDLPEQGIELDDFVSHAPSRTYFFLPCREPWPGASVNARLPKIEVTTADGELKEVSPSAWLDRHRSVEQMTWCPGEPMLIPDKLFIAAGGWIERAGVTSLNHYRAPLIEPGNAAEADKWIDHVHKVYPDNAEHIIRWLAHRVQRPAEKINHALVLGGAQGIGKDTLLEPAKYAVGPWNVAEISPTALLGRFNGFLKSVILRVSEAHDLGEFNRFALYERLKAYTAAPPDGLRVDEKHLREYTIPNCCGVVITTNHQDALYPAGRRSPPLRRLERAHQGQLRRRTTGAASGAGTTPAGSTTSRPIWPSSTSPSSTPRRRRPRPRRSGRSSAPAARPRTPSSPTCSTSWATPTPSPWRSCAPRPTRILTSGCPTGATAAPSPTGLNSCGYVPVRNPDTDDGLWRISKKRQAVYVNASLSATDRSRIAERLRWG